MNGPKARKRTRLRKSERRQRFPSRGGERRPGRLAAGDELEHGETGDPPPGVAGSAEIATREREVRPGSGEEVGTRARQTSRLREARDPRWDPVGRDLAHHGAAQRTAKGFPVERCRHRAAHVGVVERGQARVQGDESDLARGRQSDLGSDACAAP